MWKDGDNYRRKMSLSGPFKHKFGIYSKASEIDFDNSNDVKINDKVSGILKKVDTMKLNDKEEKFDGEEKDGVMTQGDKLNQIKAQRRQTKPLISST